MAVLANESCSVNPSASIPCHEAGCLEASCRNVSRKGTKVFFWHDSQPEGKIHIMIEQTQEPRSYDQVKGDARNWRRSVLAEVYKPAAATLR